jgi:signal transduction histidine kinase
VKLRSRLVLAFAYILLAVIVALTIPLAVNVSRERKTELGIDTLITAQTLAAYIGKEYITDPSLLADRLSTAAIPPEITRVVVTDPQGIVIYDSDGEDVGKNFANGQRPEMDYALGQGLPTYDVRYSDKLQANIMVAAAPIIDEELVGAIRLTRDYSDVDREVRQATVGIMAIGLAGLAGGILIAFGLAGSLVQPIQSLATAAKRLGGGDLSARAGAVGSAAEVRELGRSFDEMAERVERTVQAQREFVANASHQLRTPLTGMRLRLESVIADTPNGEVRRQLEAAEREVDRLSEIVDRLLVMSREIEQGVPTHVDLGETVDRARERWQVRAGQQGSTLHANGQGGLAQANPTDLEQVLDNLLENAITYAPGDIELQTGREGSRVWVAVRDHGSGISAAEQDRVVDRFYRGRAAPAGGSGLGLAIARELAEKWGGTLTVSSPPDGGTRIEVRLRAIDTAPAS